MKMMKKLTGFVLACMLVLSCCTLFAGAACAHEYAPGVYHAPTCTERGYTEYTCNLCGETVRDGYVDASGHFYGEWQPVAASTCTEHGLDKRICRVCQGVETRTAELLPHTDGDNDGFCDACGYAFAPQEDKGMSPHDWLVMVINRIREWFRAIFA